MGLTKIDGFTGEAELRGCLYRVQYEDGKLTVHGVHLDDAYDMLDALKAGQVTAVRVRGGSEQPAQKEVVSRAPEGPLREEARKGGGTALREEQSKAPQATAPPPPVEPRVEPAPEQPGQAPGIPDKIQKSGRFIEVMEWVMKEKGLAPTQVEAIVLAMEALKPYVKVVSRVPNLKSKVEANLAAFSESGGA